MARAVVELPPQLRQEAEQWASRQGVSFDQFVVWAVAEKIGGLKQAIDDPRFPHVTYRRGVDGWPIPVLRGTGIRVRTVACAARDLSPGEIADEYDLSPEQVSDALAFYAAHRGEIDASLDDERQIERAHA